MESDGRGLEGKVRAGSRSREVSEPALRGRNASKGPRIMTSRTAHVAITGEPNNTKMNCSVSGWPSLSLSLSHLSLSLSLSLSPLSSLLQHHRYFVSLAKFLASDDPLLELSLLDHVDAHATKDGILSLGQGGGKKRLRERSRQIGRIHSHGKTLTK